MTRIRSVTLAVSALAILSVVAGCAQATGTLGSVVSSTGPSAEPSVAQGSPDLTAEPSSEASSEPSGAPSGSGSPGGSPAPTGTTVVRAYFYLGGAPGSAGLLAVLRDVPATKAVATAAMNALLAGPTASETGDRQITSAVPAGTQLLGLAINGDVATVDLSSEFQAGGGSASIQTRLGQVVYTLTQFPTIKSVMFQVGGADLTGPVDRADYVDLLPAIWVDRPAWNAAIGNPAKVTGSSDVFEATFRVSILDGSGKVLADQQVMATCGSGCRGTFSTSVGYTISKAQYGTLRVYEPSAKDGTPVNVREYRVWLTPKS